MPKPKTLPKPADKSSSSPCISEEADIMQERFLEAQRLRRQIAELERKLDRILNLDYSRRAPAHRTLTRSQAIGKFESLEACANVHRQA